MQSRAYMKGAEFKARQGWLPFVDAIGVVLEVLEPIKAAAWGWYRKWVKGFRTKNEKHSNAVQMMLFAIGDRTDLPG